MTRSEYRTTFVEPDRQEWVAELRFNFNCVCPPWPCEMVPFPVVSGVGCNFNVYDLNGSRSRAQTGHRSPDITGLEGHQLLGSCLFLPPPPSYLVPTSSPDLPCLILNGLHQHRESLARLDKKLAD